MVLLPLSAGAAVQGNDGLIAYSDGTGIVVAKSDGTSPVTVAAAGSNPSWNGEGTKIAYQAGAAITVLTVPNPPASGGSTVTLSGTGTDPAFAPDGTKVAYVDAGEIKVRASDGTGLVTNLTNSAADDKDPSWSSDGTKIAFSRKPVGATTYSIWTMNADGTGQTQITSSGSNDTRPNFSPTGSTIAFESDRDGVGATGHQIYSVPVGGGLQTRLTNSDAATQTESAPAYSPSGTKILFGHTGTAPGIYSISAGGGSSTLVVAGTNVTPDEQAALQAGTPFISGSTTQGSTLTASTGTWRPPYNVTFAYQWQHCDSGNFCANVGTNSPTYVTNAGDVGQKMQVIVTGANGWSSVSATSAQTSTITGGPGPVNTVLPTITLPTGYDAPQVGFLLSATTGTWTGISPITFTYQWTKCVDIDKNCFDIDAATSSFFTPTIDLVNWDISVTITAKNSAGTTSVRAIPTKAVTGVPPSNHGSPVITGQNYVKQTLTTTSGIWQGLAPITYTYQWKRCDAFGTIASCVDIAGATSTTYVLTTADLDKTIRSFVTAKNPIKSVTQFSNHTFPTLPERHFPPSNAGLPAIAGLAKPGVLLRVTTGTWSGDTPFTFTYQWERCDATGASCRALKSATKNRYVVSSADLGFTIRVKQTAKNAYGTASIESTPSDAVTRSPKRPKGRRIVGTARADYLPGSGGDDTIVGRDGNDTLVGGAGNDTLIGGPGNDVIDGGPGADTIDAGPGSDTVLVADGTKDVVDCGPGNDKAVVDAIDVIKNCEAVTISAPTTTPITP